MNNAKDIATANGTFCFGSRMGKWTALLNTLMGTSGIVVMDIVAQHAPQMVFVEDEQLVQTFFSHRSNPTLGIGIGVGCTDGCMNDLQLYGTENSIERGSELAISIMNEKVQGLL